MGEVVKISFWMIKAMFLNANDVDLASLSGGDKFVELAGVVKSSNIESAIS